MGKSRANSQEQGDVQGKSLISVKTKGLIKFK